MRKSETLVSRIVETVDLMRSGRPRERMQDAWPRRNARFVDPSELPDGKIHMIVPASVSTRLRNDGIWTGTFMTSLPTAYGTREEALAEVPDGQEDRVLAVDMSVCDVALASDGQSGRMVVWGRIPPEAVIQRFQAKNADAANSMRVKSLG